MVMLGLIEFTLISKGYIEYSFLKERKNIKLKRKFRREYKIIIVLILIFIFLIYAYVKKQNGEAIFSFGSQTEIEETSSDTTVSETEAEIKTITNTIASSGEVETAISEQLELHATYYFEEVYVEENQYVAEGENILKYTNGTYMTAPYDLVITSLNIPSEGEQCTNKHYIEVSSVDTLTISASIDEEDIDTVSVGQEVEITISAINKTYTGYITHISETATYSSKGSTFSSTITFANDGDVKIGMTAEYEIVLEKAENALVVPIEAVQEENGSKYVVVVNTDGTTENVTVETGISNDAYIEIKSGLSEGDVVQVEESTSSSSGMGGMMNMEGDMQQAGGDMKDQGGGDMGGDMPDMGSGEMPSMPEN